MKLKNEEISEEKEKFYAFKIYEEARKKLLIFIGVISIVLTGFGFVSMNSISERIGDSLEQKGTENIIQEIKQNFIQSNQDAITEHTLKELDIYIEQRVEEIVNGRIQERLEKVIRVSEEEQVDLLQAIEQSYKDEKYLVITASSKDKVELEIFLNKKKEEIGNDFDLFFPNVTVRPPVEGNQYFGLALGKNLSFNNAIKVRERAIKLGFDHKTYLKLQKSHK